MAKLDRPVRSAQSCWSFHPRELALALGIPVDPDSWVVVEVEGDGRTVDVMVRRWIDPPQPDGLT